MATLVSTVTGFIAQYPHIAYGLVFLLALSEAIPVIGSVVPGSAAILAISALIPTGVVTFWPLVASAIAGAILGDGLSFWLGHHYHQRLFSLWPISRYPDLVERSEAFFARYGDKSVFIARFVPGVRTFVPVIAGALRVPAIRFYTANILSALVWGPAHVLPGILIGSAFKQFGAEAESLALLLLILIVTLWVATHVTRMVYRHATELTGGALQAIRTWSATQDSRIGQALSIVLDPARPDARLLAMLVLVLIASAWLFLGILEDVVSGDPLVRADTAIFNAFQAIRTASGDRLMIALTELGDTFVVMAVAAAGLAWLVWQRAWRTATFWLMAVVGASLLNSTIKLTLHRARPTALPYEGVGAFSFPSGHTTVNAVLYGFLAILVARSLRAPWRMTIFIAASMLVFTIAFSRIYLGAHWFSDVAAGLTFATLWLTLLAIFYDRKPVEPYGAAGLAIVSTIAFILAGGVNISREHALDTERYAIKATSQSMALADWRDLGWQKLPAYRIDLFGEIEEPLTVQWAASLPAIRQTLQNGGWHDPVSWGPASTLSWFDPSMPPINLPVFPRQASGRMPSLVLVRGSDVRPGDVRFVLRLWPSDWRTIEGMPIWVGSVVEEHTNWLFSVMPQIEMKADMNGPRDLLIGITPSQTIGSRQDIDHQSGWDGKTLLIESRH